MRRLSLLHLLLLGFLSTLLCACGTRPQVCHQKESSQIGIGSLNVIPQLQSIKIDKGAPFTLTEATSIRYPKGNQILGRDAQLLASYIQELTGLKLQVTDQPQNTPVISFTIDPNIQEVEGYHIDITNSGINISGKSETGIFYGIQTLRKSLPIGTFNRVSLPAAKIVDYPRFGYRGFMIDVGRHFFSVPYLKKLIDLMALHNINYFHWHLTDDQGWRIEIKKYPKLISIGSHRPETIIKHGSNKFDHQPVSGYYTQAEAREIVRYAAERHITVIPEIDMPGHMLAALASYPELGCTGGPYKVATQFGVFKDVLCAGNPKSVAFATDVLNEIMDIFPSKYIHIGGDECPKDRWKNCPKCQAKIDSLGIKETPEYSKENQLQAYFMGQMEKVINARGRKMLAWNEILRGNPTKSTTILAWTSPKAGVESAKKGYNTVICPISNLYFSNPHYNQITGVKSTDRVLLFEPVSKALTPQESKQIIGAEGCIWTEWTKDAFKMEWQILPRMAALSEIQWTLPEHKNRALFYESLPHMIKLYKKLGYSIKQDIYEPSIFITPSKEDPNMATVRLENFDGATIYYTTDGTKPAPMAFGSTQTMLYKGPFSIKRGTIVKAVSKRGNEFTGVVENRFKLK